MSGPRRRALVLALLTSLALVGVGVVVGSRLSDPLDVAVARCLQACLAGGPDERRLPAWCSPGQKPSEAPTALELRWLCELQCRPDEAP